MDWADYRARKFDRDPCARKRLHDSVVGRRCRTLAAEPTELGRRQRSRARRTEDGKNWRVKGRDVDAHSAASKVPAVTLGFWIIKVLATTLGETGGDTVNMTMNLGYLVGIIIFFTLLLVLVILQIAAQKFHPFLYWATIIASTTAGTTLADLADRSAGMGYPGGSLLLLACVLASLAIWYWAAGSISVNAVNTPKVEAFYWSTITFSQTLGTALGDWAADSGLGYAGGALGFGAALALVAILYVHTRISHVALFWAAFILSRPLGATIGDFFDKPFSQGGLAFSRPIASAVLAAAIIVCIVLIPQRSSQQVTRGASRR